MSPKSTREIVVCFGKFVTVDSTALESTSGRRKRSWKRLWLEWPSWYPLGLTFAGSLVAPSMESRTRTSPNFGKTNIVSQFIFHLIFMLLQLLCRFSVYLVISSRYLQFGLNIEIERSKFGAVLQKPCIPDTSGIRALCWKYLFSVLTLCCRVVASRYILYSLFTLWLTCEGWFYS